MAGHRSKKWHRWVEVMLSLRNALFRWRERARKLCQPEGVEGLSVVCFPGRGAWMRLSGPAAGWGKPEYLSGPDG